jgi:endonuclease YncB( thermonuclease family)
MSLVAHIRANAEREVGMPLLGRFVFTVIVGSIFLAAYSIALCDDLIGQVSIIDGDTIVIRGTRIRLWGIDAPESSQLCRGEDSLQYRCGARAANELDAFIASRLVACVRVSVDQYRRTVASCSVDGSDIAYWLVQNGLALDWPTYSHGKYGLAQRDAELHGRNLWAGSYAKPWQFRACIRRGGRPAECSDESGPE